MNLRMLSGLLVLLLSIPAYAQQRTFTRCIADWQSEGQARGLSSRTLEEVIPKLRHLPEIIGYDRRQPEFMQTFAQYLNLRVTPARIDKGQFLLSHHQDFLDELTTVHGVPGHYLVAFWGMETAFGKHLGKMPTLDALATLACDPRRSDYFTEELYQALQLMERETLTHRQMHGSWAGAMGHTQFMPSAYRAYAIDGDNDGRINLWRSEYDALASGANFLKHLGWRREQRWGREVLLPDGFSYETTGLDNRKPVSYWSGLGVSLPDGKPLPQADFQASILVPAGHTGPAFMVYANFDVIMKWNRSESYALAVGLLADQIAGAPPLTRPPSLAERPLDRNTLLSLQARLNELGYNAGKPDGIMGPNTRAALRAYQQASGLIADGYPDSQTRQHLLDRLSSSLN